MRTTSHKTSDSLKDAFLSLNLPLIMSAALIVAIALILFEAFDKSDCTDNAGEIVRTGKHSYECVMKK